MIVCHITSAHPVDDIRIYHKECLSLYNNNFNIHILGVVPPKIKNPKTPFSLVSSKSKNLIYRFFFLPFKILIYAKKINADVYHLHDPDLLIVGLFLKKTGKIVIYDIHEDNPKAILSRDWGFKFLRKFISVVFKWYENGISKKLNYLIAATPGIHNRFCRINNNTFTINNYPILTFLKLNTETPKKKRQICFAGLISPQRGLEYVVKAMEFVHARLLLIGNFTSEDFLKKLKSLNGWANVDYLGYQSRELLENYLTESCAGIVTFLSLPNHTHSQPNKMFEYMAAGLPVIASNFPLWEEIIDKNKCGICVNPENPEEIAGAISFLFENPSVAKKMGENGKEAVLNKYNWELESNKLIRFYNSIRLNE